MKSRPFKDHCELGYLGNFGWLVLARNGRRTVENSCSHEFVFLCFDYFYCFFCRGGGGREMREGCGSFYFFFFFFFFVVVVFVFYFIFFAF
ncbi:MAG: hypothetical protein ACLPHI_00580 [Terriglobales bacterium]